LRHYCAFGAARKGSCTAPYPTALNESLVEALAPTGITGEQAAQEFRKGFRILAPEIKPIATGLGSCIASDRITRDGMKVGYMHREATGRGIDSGWRFFAGDESEGYATDPNHFAIYDVNTIANYDPMIVTLLDSPPPCAFERDVSGRLVPAPLPNAEV
jgi:hypothetical protein